MRRPARHLSLSQKLDSVATVESGKVSAQQQPEIGSTRSNYKHDDHIVLEAGGIENMPIVRADRSHEET